MVNEGTQMKLFETVIDIQEARNKKEGQQKLFEKERRNRPIPYGQVEDLFNAVNVGYTKTQEELKATQQELKASANQTNRLANSLENIISQVPGVGIDIKDPMVKWGYLKDGDISDVAIADGTKIPSEQAYPLMSWEIVEKIGHKKLTASIVGIIFKKLNLKGDTTFHYDFPSGRSGVTPRYKPCVIPELYERMKNYEKYGIPQDKALRWQGYFKPESEVIK
jgi:hypothetical protein